MLLVSFPLNFLAVQGLPAHQNAQCNFYLHLQIEVPDFLFQISSCPDLLEESEINIQNNEIILDKS